MESIGKILIVVGVVLIIFGLMAWGKLGPLGRLPGDFSFSGEKFQFYFPLTSGIIISLILSLIFWLLNKFLK